MKVAKVGVLVVDLYSEPPEPYEAYMADLFECPKCGNRTIAGRGEQPVACAYEPVKMASYIRNAKENCFRIPDRVAS